MTERPPYSLAQLTLYFLKLGSIGFGGPVALVGYMYRDLVEKRRWITDEDYDGVTAAAIGAITGAVIVLAERSIIDFITALMALVTIVLIWRVKKLPEPAVVAVAAVIGFLAYPGMHP